MFGTYRLILALLVALSHFGFTKAGLHPGQWAVIAFYILSGFLMERQFTKLAPTGILSFYIDRILRIYPLYIVALILTIPFFQITWQEVIVNAALIPLNYYEFTNTHLLIGPAFSLACEVHFYLLVPFLATRSTKTLRIIFWSSLFIFAISPFLHYNTFFAYTGIPGTLFIFITGIFINRNEEKTVKAAQVVIPILLVLFGLSKFFPTGLHSGINISVCIGYILAVPIIQRLVVLSPKNKWDKALGLLSYPLFLIHETVKLALQKEFQVSNILMQLFISVIVAALLVFIVEKPFDYLRYRIRKNEKTSSVAT
ncbi:MAG: acyltransferase [Chlorobiales bacterium]|nr:acyltransferase [Chlorobiales bacterium]